MSTFDGKVKEFPDIRIDHFRLSGETSRPPLAYLLSHVHSDHLEGLESCKSPFIYCSPATKEILLRLEKYPHRMNFAKGILETRKQTYKHLKKLLKAIPLETPTVIDMAPGRSIRVTLFDANHCVGAVMFLVEGDGKAILYTGDIRSELWWVNNLTRRPLMLAYALNGGKRPLKQLDCIYLDTTFANKDNPYKHFPSKAEGTSELLQKISKYPKDTVFYFDTWTFGYEDVWMALCSFLGCQVHVDDYRYNLYRALATGEGLKAEEAPRLFGYKFGNHVQEGCLTVRQTRLHSCEQGTGCEVFKRDFVRITPIISRHEGMEMAELGTGGGKGDLDQQHELEVGDTSALGMLMSLCATKMQDQPKLLGSVLGMLASIMKDPVRAISLDSAILHANQPSMNHEDMSELDQLPLDSLIPALTSLAAKDREHVSGNAPSAMTGHDALPKSNPHEKLPKRITFPYSRHSSYTELCHLIEAFKPKDIWPCTVDKADWSMAQSMGFLYGHLYESPCKFTHDQEMSRRMGHKAAEVPDSRAVSPGQPSPPGEVNGRSANGDRTVPRETETLSHTAGTSTREDTSMISTGAPHFSTSGTMEVGQDCNKVNDISSEDVVAQPPRKRRHSNDDSNTKNKRLPSIPADSSASVQVRSAEDSHERSPKTPETNLLSSKEYTEAWQHEAFEAALGTSPSDWNDITLVSVSGHQKRETEL